MTTKGTILVVDDAPASLKLMTALLEAEGYHVRPADSGALALASVEADPPELILLDVRMRGLDGFEVLRRLKAQERTRDIPVMIMSASAEMTERAEGLNLGAVDFISKPIHGQELLARVQTHLELRRLRVWLEEQADDLRRTNERLQDELAERQRATAELVTLNKEALASRIAALNLMDDAVESRKALETANQELRSEMAEHERAEAALRESEQRYRAIAQSANEPFITVDAAGTIVGWNPAAQRLFGYAESEACGQPLTLVIPPRLFARHRDAMARIRAGDKPRLVGAVAEMVGLRRDGSEFPLELSLSNWETSQGQHFTGIVRDLTERKAAEATRLRMADQLRQAQKMEAVGRLAGGVAHDFNNMLAVICGYTDLALMNLDPSDPSYADIQEVAKTGRRSADLVRQLLAFARQQTIAPRALDLNHAIASMLKMLQRLIGEDVALRWKPGDDLGAVVMDPAQVDQVLANLMINARDAIGGVGAVSIETGAAEFDEGYCATHPGVVPGKYVLLAVSDDGSGMNSETLTHIFEPFFTTKSPGQGTGLGLSTVYGIVKQNEGFIDVASEPGRGTTFSVYLPMHERLDAAADETHLSADKPTCSETVLFVEDDEALLRLGLRMLERLGYTVLSTGSPNQAIDMVKDYRGAIDLLVTDVVMPEMNGRHLHQRLNILRPGLKCLFTSGYTANVIAHRGVLDDGVSFLAKPYTAKAFAAKIRDVISAP